MNISMETERQYVTFYLMKNLVRLLRKLDLMQISLNSDRNVNSILIYVVVVVVVVLLFYVHGKHLRSCWDGQLT